MTWETVNDDEVPLYYISNAVNQTNIERDIGIVVSKMINNRQIENVTSDVLFFYVNATNSWITLSWYDIDTGKVNGRYIYTLSLASFGELTLSEGDGAFTFDETCLHCIWLFAGTHCYTEEGDIIYRVYQQTELDDEPEELII